MPQCEATWLLLVVVRVCAPGTCACHHPTTATPLITRARPTAAGAAAVPARRCCCLAACRTCLCCTWTQSSLLRHQTEPGCTALQGLQCGAFPLATRSSSTPLRTCSVPPSQFTLLGNTDKGTFCCSRLVTHTQPVSVWAEIASVPSAVAVLPQSCRLRVQARVLTRCCLFVCPAAAAAAAGCLASACTLLRDRTWKQPRHWGP